MQDSLKQFFNSSTEINHFCWVFASMQMCFSSQAELSHLCQQAQWVQNFSLNLHFMLGELHCQFVLCIPTGIQHFPVRISGYCHGTLTAEWFKAELRKAKHPFMAEPSCSELSWRNLVLLNPCLVNPWAKTTLSDMQVITAALRAHKSVSISQPISQRQEKLLNAVFHFLLIPFNVKLSTP